MKRILIVDDDKTDFTIHRKMLEMAGYDGEIIYYDNAESTLTFLKGLLNQPSDRPEYFLLILICLS